MNDTVSLTQQGAVMAFYEDKFGRMPTKGEAYDRLSEEIDELLTAFSYSDTRDDDPDPFGYDTTGSPAVHILKEMADVMYTLYGYALARGWNLERAFERVHASNMGKPKSVDGQKVQKGEGYTPPDLSDCL